MANDLETLASMEYPGRFLIVGKSVDGIETIACYGLTGRSTSSQARTFAEGKTTCTIRTQVTDQRQLENGSPALLLYPAMAFHEGAVVASNGAQTKLLYTHLRFNIDIMHTPKMVRENNLLHRSICSDVLCEALKKPFYEYDQKDDRWIDITAFEPDAPHYTPRINLVTLGDHAIFSIIKNDSTGFHSHIHNITLEPGLGKLLSTYTGENKEPLPSFQGDPLPVNTPWLSPEKTVSAVYDALNPKYRVCVVAVHTDGKKIRTARIDRHANEVST